MCSVQNLNPTEMALKKYTYFIILCSNPLIPLGPDVPSLCLEGMNKEPKFSANLS